VTQPAITTLADCEKVGGMDEMLPVDPFRSLYVHFGMLLGVDDFRTVDAYHRGKMWFHSAWLHRQGTLWGLRVQLDQAMGEVRVKPGAAVDALGRELYLNAPACLNVSAWYNQHKDEPELSEIVTTDPETGYISFDAHVVIKFKACLNRQVPALKEPCDGSNSTTAYSRVNETVMLCLKPGKAPEWRAPGQLPFHRLRLLFGLEDPLTDEGEIIPEDDEVVTKRDWILTLPVEDQPAAYLEAFRYFAAKDEMEMTPASDSAGGGSFLFPATDPACIPLANIEGLTLMAVDDSWEVIDGEVDNAIRPVHVPTSTIQELTCGPQCQCGAPAPVEPPPIVEEPDPIADAGGPRIDPESVQLQGEILTFELTGPPLMKASVEARAISVTAFDTRDGWVTAEIKDVRYKASEDMVTVELIDAPGAVLVRLIASGTGPYPLLGRIGHNRIPLAGAVGGSPGTAHDGNDFVFMFKRGGDHGG